MFLSWWEILRLHSFAVWFVTVPIDLHEVYALGRSFSTTSKIFK